MQQQQQQQQQQCHLDEPRRLAGGLAILSLVHDGRVLVLLPSLPTHRALALTSALRRQGDCEDEDIKVRLVKNLKSCEVGQVEAASRLELAELVQLLRYLSF